MERNKRKILVGVVISDKMQKTVVVRVETKNKHPLYKKLVITHKKYHAHDEQEICKIGDLIQIVETRPLSALKRWRVDKIVEKAK